MRTLQLLLIFFIPIVADCQLSMRSVFMQLPVDCTPELDSKGRALLFQNQVYVIPGGDSLETIQYTIENSSPNYLNYVFSFTTGQRAFSSFELRRFKTTNGLDMIVFSKYSGLPVAFYQDKLQIFYVKNKKLAEDKKQKLLPQSININEFLKKDVPDSIKKIIEKEMSSNYSLNSVQKNSIEFSIYSQAFDIEVNKDWMICYSFLFTWTGSKFVRKINTDFNP